MANEKRLIDVADALERLRKAETNMRVVDFLGIKAVDIGSVIQFLESRKTVDAVEVKHGRWVHPEGYVVSNGFLCSVCNHAETSYRPIHPLGGGYFRADENGNFYYPPNMNYCPNCGAKMDGDGNENV